MIQACLNGPRPAGEHPALPVEPQELAADAWRAVAAGADELHVHPRGPDGADTLERDRVATTVEAIREACPGVPLGLTTGLWAVDGDLAHRLELVRSWTVLPDYVSVNLGEDGFEDLCSLLAEGGVGVEAGVWSMEDAHALAGSGVRPLRTLVEVMGSEPGEELARAREIAAVVEGPQLHHGMGVATWTVIEAAVADGHDVRIGLEDTLVLPDGSTTPGNAELVAEAVRRLGGS